ETTGRGLRFNGAAVIDRGKPRPRSAARRRDRRFNGAAVIDRGKHSSPTPLRRSLPGFNGAAVIDRGKPHMTGASVRVVLGASMGPRSSTAESGDLLGG